MDAFMSRIADLASKTAVECFQLAGELNECGLVAQAIRLKRLAMLFVDVQADCDEQTQPYLRVPRKGDKG